MSVQSLSFLLASIIAAALAVAMLIRGGKSRLFLSFAALNGVLFLYYLAAFIYGVSHEALWLRLRMMAALALAPAAIHFFNIFLGQPGSFSPKAARASLTLSILLAPFVLSELINRYLVKAIVAVLVLSALLLCLLMIFVRLRHTTSRVESARLKYLLYGGMVAVALSLADFAPNVDLPWFAAIGNTIAVLYLYFLSQIIIQFRLLDLNELVGKMLVLATLVTVLAAVYTLIGLFVTDIPGLIFFNTFIAAFVILILFEPIHRLVEQRVNRLLFRERYEFGRQLALLRRELANVIDVNQMCQLILTRLENSRRVTGASVYLLEEGSNRLRALGYVGPPPVEAVEAVAERPFIDRVREAKALVIETVEAELHEALRFGDDSNLPERDALSETLRVLRALEADVCLALISEDRVIGLLNVCDDRMNESYSPEEIAHLGAIAGQASICVENSRIVTRIRDRDRLAAVGEMAAGLAHEVRNPLGAIKGAAQMLAEEQQDGSETAEFIDIIVEEVNRLNKVVSAFLDYAKPYAGAAGPTPINPVIERVVTLLRKLATDAGVTVETDLLGGLPPARIDPEVLRQVLWNLCLNAIDAMADREVRTLTIATRPGTRSAPMQAGYFGHETLEISIGDTGVGIPPENLERIFLPFYTTKERGTGLGLAICQRLIRAAGGAITATSTPGEGSTFTVRLALWAEDSTSISADRRRGDLGVGR